MERPDIQDALLDHQTWADTPAQLERLAWLRANDPVRRGETRGFVPYWHVTRHADLFAVERSPEAFVVRPRSLISPIEQEERVRALTGGHLNLIEALVMMDDPKHYKHRAVAQVWFMPSNLKKIDEDIRRLADEAVEGMTARGGTCDFARDVAAHYPLGVIMRILGLPDEDWGRMLTLTQELFGNSDAEVARDPDALAGIVATYMDFVAYFRQLTEDRRARPTDDVASVIANARIEGEHLGEQEAMGYYTIVATAGHDTTSYVTTEAVRALAEVPGLLGRLRADPEGTAPLIVDEALRLAAPVRHFVRTATRDVEIGGVTVPEGECVVVWFPSACRDEGVFAEPDRFDIDRSRQGHSPAFGTGPHICLGMHLARQEVTRFLEAFGRRVSRVELTGEPVYMRSNFVGGMRSLPIAFEVA